MFSFGLQFILTARFYYLEFIIAENRWIYSPWYKISLLSNFQSNHHILMARASFFFFSFFPVKDKEIMSLHKFPNAQTKTGTICFQMLKTEGVISDIMHSSTMTWFRGIHVGQGTI